MLDIASKLRQAGDLPSDLLLWATENPNVNQSERLLRKASKSPSPSAKAIRAGAGPDSCGLVSYSAQDKLLSLLQQMSMLVFNGIDGTIMIEADSPPLEDKGAAALNACTSWAHLGCRRLKSTPAPLGALSIPEMRLMYPCASQASPACALIHQGACATMYSRTAPEEMPLQIS